MSSRAQITFDERQEGLTGAFVADAKMTSHGGRELFASASGRGRGKQIARQVRGAGACAHATAHASATPILGAAAQVASAMLLETLLQSVSAEDLLAPGRNNKAVKQWQVGSAERGARWCRGLAR